MIERPGCPGVDNDLSSWDMWTDKWGTTLTFQMPVSPVRSLVITSTTLGVQNLYLSVSGDNEWAYELKQQPATSSSSMVTIPCLNVFVWSSEKSSDLKKISYYSPNLVAGQCVYVPPTFGSLRRMQIGISWLDA